MNDAHQNQGGSDKDAHARVCSSGDDSVVTRRRGGGDYLGGYGWEIFEAIWMLLRSIHAGFRGEVAEEAYGYCAKAFEA
jgi:hypothetical protein